MIDLLFGTRRPVGRRAYLVAGLSLTALKFLTDSAIIRTATGRTLTPLQFLVPSLAERESLLRGAPPGTGWLLVTWMLPFVWIAVSMSVRRAVDAGFSPWNGLLVLVPFGNLATMAMLALLPSRAPPAGAAGPSRATRGLDLDDASGPQRPPLPVHLRAQLEGLLVGCLAGFPCVWLSTQALRDYGLALFVGTPVVMGAVAVLVATRSTRLTGRSALALGAGVVALGEAAMLLVAMEGLYCLLMALPIAMPLGMLGGMIALCFSGRAKLPGAVAAVLAVPLCAGIEAVAGRALPPLEHEVLTAVEIDAPPEAVWPLVIAFPDLPAPTDGLFSHGIAWPAGASIDGEGVGAIRRCEFSTGAFVEPITAWEPPVRLAFDVAEEPPPMVEWSPWGAIDAPHLHGYLRSRRGEFRLVAIDGSRTRLEGRTWYELDMAPQRYWLLWSDAIIHRIHLRVLEHIRGLAESRGR